MKKELYPVIFHAEDVGYSVFVPDLEGCVSQGDTLYEAYENILSGIGLYLEDQFDNLPKPSDPSSITLSEQEFLSIIEFDPAEYLRKNSSKSVKKTLTIPAWLNYKAEQEGVNFSNILQTALKEKLGI